MPPTSIFLAFRAQGLVIALDRSPPKADIITRLAERLGLTCIAALPWDATTLVQSDSGGAASVDELRALAQLPLAEVHTACSRSADHA